MFSLFLTVYLVHIKIYNNMQYIRLIENKVLQNHLVVIESYVLIVPQSTIHPPTNLFMLVTTVEYEGPVEGAQQFFFLHTNLPY